MSDRLNIIYDWLSPEDIPAALEIEHQGFYILLLYPYDLFTVRKVSPYRQSNAGELFLGAYLVNGIVRELVGYVCATLSPSESLTHESMSTHTPLSSSVCIHSVCVSLTQRGRKIGLNLLKEYISRLEAANKAGLPYQRILLITHEYLRSFYEEAGFEWLGKSSVIHGDLPWYEMRKILVSDASAAVPDTIAIPDTQPEEQQKSQTIPPGLWDALQRPTPSRPSSRSFSSFSGGIADIIQPHPHRDGVAINKFDLTCPRNGCGSIILKTGIGEWVERASVQMEPESLPTQSLLAPLPPPPETCQWWLIGPSPMEFENIGFSRPVQAESTTGSETLIQFERFNTCSSAGPRLKLLACAECDLGPLGWCEEGGKEFWLACERVAYRV
ncbi:putative N-acetyltransferase C9.02c [Hypsizygus marmoreus]|uniref:N-acetyltransferase C9.02c n=1 Tax=Hypsizygus marmoreus TaxID=39966 RepID=A0A369K759_HYPMA|nr:putative N-acetyltransferase C9.02c [Hypsizygus marmoreus]